MSSSMKDVFYHALLARAAYADLRVGSDLVDSLMSAQQSDMSKEMAEFIQDRFEVVDSSLNNDASLTYDPLSGKFLPTWRNLFGFDGYDAVLFKKRDSDEYVLANRGKDEFGIGFNAKDIKQLFSWLSDGGSEALLLAEGETNQADSMIEFLKKNKLLINHESMSDEEKGQSATFSRLTATGHGIGANPIMYLLDEKEKGDYLFDYAYSYNGIGLRYGALDFIEDLAGDAFDIETDPIEGIADFLENGLGIKEEVERIAKIILDRDVSIDDIPKKSGRFH